MVRQRWSEAGLFRRLSVVLLGAQAVFISVAFALLNANIARDGEGLVGVLVFIWVTASLVPFLLNGMTAWAILFGSLRARVWATLLSAATLVFWLPNGGWVGLAIAVVAVATTVVVWRHDEGEGVVGIRPFPAPD
jgi:hypothetical protein